MRHACTAQVGSEWDGVPSCRRRTIHRRHGVTLLAVQAAVWRGARLCPAGLADGNLHVLSEGDVVMAMGHDAQAVLQAVGSESSHPDDWPSGFTARDSPHIGRGPIARIVLVNRIFRLGIKGVQPQGNGVGHVQRVVKSEQSDTAAAAAAAAHDPSLESSLCSSANVSNVRRWVKTSRLSTVQWRRIPPAADGAAVGGESGSSWKEEKNVVVGGLRRQVRWVRRRDYLGALHDSTISPPSPLIPAREVLRVAQKTRFKSVSTKSRNLCVLTAKLSAAQVVRDASAVARKKRQEGRDERSHTPWITISRIAKTGNHIIIMVNNPSTSMSTASSAFWDELTILLYRLRGNDGTNIKPIIVVSKIAPTVQELTVLRSIEVYVTEGSFNDKGVLQHLGLERAASVIVMADACSSESVLLMDRSVLLATSCWAEPGGRRRIILQSRQRLRLLQQTILWERNSWNS